MAGEATRALLGARVEVRRVGPADREEFVRLALQSTAFHHPWIQAPLSGSDFARYVARFDGAYAIGFVLRDREAGELVGFVNLNEIVMGPYRRGLLGYGLFEPAAGRGYMVDGLAVVMRYAFDVLKLHRLEADIQPANYRSRLLVTRLGFRCEGLSPGFICIDDTWVDHERWAITAQMRRSG